MLVVNTKRYTLWLVARLVVDKKKQEKKPNNNENKNKTRNVRNCRMSAPKQKQCIARVCVPLNFRRACVRARSRVQRSNDAQPSMCLSVCISLLLLPVVLVPVSARGMPRLGRKKQRNSEKKNEPLIDRRKYLRSLRGYCGFFKTRAGRAR